MSTEAKYSLTRTIPERFSRLLQQGDLDSFQECAFEATVISLAAVLLFGKTPEARFNLLRIWEYCTLQATDNKSTRRIPCRNQYLCPHHRRAVRQFCTRAPRQPSRSRTVLRQQQRAFKFRLHRQPLEVTLNIAVRAYDRGRL
jgi:hypothetical protein